MQLGNSPVSPVEGTEATMECRPPYWPKVPLKPNTFGQFDNS